MSLDLLEETMVFSASVKCFIYFFACWLIARLLVERKPWKLNGGKFFLSVDQVIEETPKPDAGSFFHCLTFSNT